MNWFSDAEFKKVQDEIVIGCVDVVIIDENDRVLLGKRANQPLKDWWIFGGRMSVGEHYQDTTRRVLDRELGLYKYAWQRIVGTYLLEYNDDTNGRMTHLLVAPLVKVMSKDIDTTLIFGDDHSSVRWFTSEDLAEMILHPYLTPILNEAGLLVGNRSEAITAR